MRISNNMMVYNFLTSLNKSQNRMNNIQEQLSDGKLVHRPSDDPIRAFRGLRFNVDLTMNEQYTQNAKDAAQWLNQTDSALSNLDEVIIKAKETMIQAISANPPGAQQALGSQIDSLINQAVTIGNTQIGERYIFAGQQDKVAGGPFARMTLNIGGVIKDCVVYRGDLNKISMPVQAGPSDPTRDSINVTGADVFGPLTQVTDSSGQAYQVAKVFSDLIDIKNMLTAGVPRVSAPEGGAATVGGNYNGTARQSFQVRIDPGAGSVNGLGQVVAAQYSTDDGTTWMPAVTTAGSPSVVALPNGISLNIAARSANAPGDVYSFQIASGAGAAPDLKWLSDIALEDIERNYDRILLSQTQIGARMASYEMYQNMMENDSAAITENMSANDDLDIAKATIDFKNNENVYRTALAVGARIMPPSLADFLR